MAFAATKITTHTAASDIAALVLAATAKDRSGPATSGNDEIRGTSGNDTILGLGGDDELRGRSGDDVLDGGDGNDRVRGDGGNDTVLGGIGNDRVEGKSGNDDVQGGDGNDRVKGGDGDDVVTGGLGNDGLWGDLGLDTFVFGVGDGNDKVHDFNEAEDRIDLSAFGFASAADVLALIVSADLDNDGDDDALDSLIVLSPTQVIHVENILPGEFTAGNFII